MENTKPKKKYYIKKVKPVVPFDVKLSDTMLSVKLPRGDEDIIDLLEHEVNRTGSRSRNSLVINIIKEYFENKKNLKQ